MNNYFLLKLFIGEEYNIIFDKLRLHLENNLHSTNVNKKNVINQISWITKSLALKGHNKMSQWIDWVIFK